MLQTVEVTRLVVEKEHPCKLLRWIDVGDDVLVDPVVFNPTEEQAFLEERDCRFVWGKVIRLPDPGLVVVEFPNRFRESFRPSEILAIIHGGEGEAEFWRDSFVWY